MAVLGAAALALALVIEYAGANREDRPAVQIDPQSPGYTFFTAEVAPNLGPACGGADGGCHAQPASRFEQSMGEHPEAAWFFPVDAKTMRIATPQQIDFLYQKLLTPERNPMGAEVVRADVRTEPRFSMVLRKPLTESAGGVIHGGGDVFMSTRDPVYRAIAQWIGLERQLRRADPVPLEGGVAGAFYQDNVLPVLVNNGCMAPGCHEINHTNLLFDPGVASDDPSEPLASRFDNALANKNRHTSLGLGTNQLSLSGDVSHSRFLRKVLPLRAGGVLHKGGNHQFLEGLDDPDFEVLLEWARLEREELLSNVKIAGRPVTEAEMGAVRGLLFVRSRRENHRRIIDVGKYLPGGDIWLLKLRDGETLETATGPPINLTAQFHAGQEADVREPELRYDARALLFAMRVGEEDNLNIYEIELDANLDYVPQSFRRLTYGPEYAKGTRVHFTDPTYVPSADDENALTSGYNLEQADIVWATNIDGEVAPAQEYGVLGEVDSGDASTILDWERFEPNGSYVGRRIFVTSGDGPTEVRTIAGFETQLAGEVLELFVELFLLFVGELSVG